MGNPISLTDLDKFLASPVKAPAAKQPSPAPEKPFVGPPKPPIPQINSPQDLDKFLAAPIQSFDMKPVQQMHEKQQKTAAWQNEGKTPEDLAPAPEFPHMLDYLGWLNSRWRAGAEHMADKMFADPQTALHQHAEELRHLARDPNLTDNRQRQAYLSEAKQADADSARKTVEQGDVEEYKKHGALTRPLGGPEAYQTGRWVGRGLFMSLSDWYSPIMMALHGFGKVGELAGEMKGAVGKLARPVFMAANAAVGGKFSYDQVAGGIQQVQQGQTSEGWSNIGGGVSVGLMTAIGVLKAAPNLKPEEVRNQTVDRLEALKKTLSQMPAMQRAQQLQALQLPGDLTVDQVQAAIDSMKAGRERRLEPPMEAPEKRHTPEYYALDLPPQPPAPKEVPDYYTVNVRPMSPEERTAKAYSLETARSQLDAERQVAAQEQDTRDAAEKDRQRIAKERQENAQGEAAYREARAGKLVVQDRRPLQFDNESARQNYDESERLSGVLDDVAVEHLYENTEDMVRSLRMERYRGIDLQSKYGDWADNALKTDARRREYLKLSDPRAVEPIKSDLLKDAAQDMRLSEREMNMRAAADKIDRDAVNVTDPEVFEKAKADADEARKLAEDLRTQRDEVAAHRAAQIADRQIYPVGAPIDLTMGSPTEVILPSGRRLKAHYAVVPGDQIVTSHNPLTFEWNDDYGPRQAQPRDYSTNQEAQAGVITGGNQPEPERVHTDDPTGHNGPPVIRRDGLVLGGNGRTMRLQRAFRLGNGDSIFRHLRSKLDQFGLSDMPELEKKPSLVRVLDEDVETAEDLFVLGRDLNRTETMGFDEAEAAVVAGRAMTDHMMSWGAAQMDALGEDASVRDFMRARGGEIIQQMMDSGMIEPTKRAAYITKNGEMTEAAKDLFEAAWLGKIIDDPDLLKTAPKDVLRKLSRGVPGLVKAKVAGSMWDIAPEAKGALRLWKRIDSIRDSLNEIGKKGDSLVDRYLHPQDFENGTELMDFGAGTAREVPHPAEEAIAKLLEKSQIEVRDGFSDYGNEAEGKQAQLLGPRPEPVDAFNQFIGKKVDIEVKPEQWAVPMPEVVKEAVPAAEAPVERRPDNRVEEPPAAPASLGEAPRPTGDVVEKLKAVLSQHPGFQGIADEFIHIADILSKNGLSKNSRLPEILADVRTEGEPGAEGLTQSISDVGNWARRAGKKLTITPYGEQLGLFGGAEPQYILRNRVGDERLVLQSELLKLRADVPKIQELVDAAGHVTQPELFGAEEENLFGPGPDEEDESQGTLFQAPPDLDARLKETFANSKSVGSNENGFFARAKEELFPGKRELSNAEMQQVSARSLEMRKESELSQGKKGAVSFLENGKAIMYLYKTADASTFLHEFFHVMRRNLKPEDLAVLEDWLKIEDGKWSRSNEEKAARAFEYYHRQREVEALPENVRGVFKKIQNVMRKIYEALKGSPLIKPSKEVSALFDRWYGMEKPPEVHPESEMESNRRVESGSPESIEAPPEARKPERKGARYRNARIVDEGKGKIVVYDLRGREAGRFTDKVEATKFVDAKTMAAEPLVGVAVDVPQDLGPESEKIPAAAEMEQPPLTTAEREGAKLVADGGRKLLDTGTVRVKTFPAYDEAVKWATGNAKKMRSFQLYKLKDGRYVADFVAKGDNVLFQNDETSDINREIAGLQKRLMSIIPEQQRAMIAQRLFDLEERRRSIPLSAPSLEPPPGKVVRLWTSEGEEAVIPKKLEEPRVPEAKPVRTATHDATKFPEPPRFGGVPERAEPSRVSRPEPAPRQPVRSGRGTEEPRVVGGQPTGTLRDVTPIRIDAPEKPSKPPVYSDKDWNEKAKLYNLPEDAPTPTVGISNNLARMLMGGQRYIVESALSGLDRYNSFILATSTGTGKTYSASAIMHHLLEEKPDAQILVMTPSQGLVGTFKDVAGDFGIEIQDLDAGGPTGQPGVYATTWAASLNRPGIETHPWDLVIADEVQEARKWWQSKRGQQMKTMSGNADKVLYMSATPFHCLAPGTPVLMHDGSVKPVENVCAGELVMGPDSKPRRVRGLSHGFGQMYEVTPKKGTSYKINENHILSLRMAGRTAGFQKAYGKRYLGWRSYPPDATVNVSVKEYLQLPKSLRERLLGHRARIDFDARPVPIDPHWLGLWLGDGTCRGPAVCVANTDPEIELYIRQYAERLGLVATEEKCNAPTVKLVRISRGRRGSVKGKFGKPSNPLLASLRALGVIGKDSINKHIPDAYKTNSREVRLHILAGIIDSDGTCNRKAFNISTKSQRLAFDIAFLARSLGFAAYPKPIFYAKAKRPDLPNWQIQLSGDLEAIPTLLRRKQCARRKYLSALPDQSLPCSRNAKDVLKVGISVKPCGIGEFYGFELDGDQLFVLGDFTITHNSALEIGHMDKLGLWQKEGFDNWARQFGVGKDEEGNYTGGNAPLKLTKLRTQLIERGQMINVDRDMSGYGAHFGVVPMDGATTQGLKNIQQAMDLAENYFYAANKRGKVMPTRAQAVTLAKRFLEFQRLPQAIELGKKLQDQGWKVIFFSENKKEFGEVFEFLKEADEGTGGKISQLLPKFRSVTDVLQEHFGDDVGIFAGKHSAARQSELTGFNEGDKKHIYATYGAGGVGVSLHDTVGNAPRAVVYLGPPWSGISFDQALGRPWRYGTRSNVRAYFLFSNAQAEMDIVQNKVAPRMESLRALVSGVHLTDPLVKAMREIPDNREATLDYELGNEHKAGMDQFTNTADTRTVTSYSELPIVHADQAKNKGMKLPGGEGATAPNVVKLFQDGNEDEIVPADQENPALQTARNINVDLAQEFISSGAAPGNTGARNLTPIERRRVADVVMAQAEGAARGNPAAATQAVYTAWQNAMTQIDAIMSASSGGGGMEPPPHGGVEAPPSPEDPGNLQTLNWYFATNGRDVIRNAAKAAGVPEVGEKLARDIASYHVYAGNQSGPWVDEYWRILKDNGISKEEHKVVALTMANREERRPWIDRELMRLRAETPMNDRIAKAVTEADALRRKVFRKMQDADVYLTVYDANTGAPRKVMYQEMNLGQGYWPRKYDYDEVHTVTDPESGQEIKFTLRQMTKKEGPGTTKREQIIRGMMERHGLSRAGVEDWLGSRKRPVPLVGHVERAREADLPFFRTDPNVMISYLEGAGEVLARKKYFGQDGDKVAGTIAQIPNKKMRDTTKEIIDSLLQHNPMEDESRWMLRLASDWSVLSKMTFSAVKALGHSAHGALSTGIRSYFGGLFEGIFNHKEAQHLADLSGSVMEQTKIEMLSEYGVNKKGIAASILKYNMWQGAYKFGRVVADANARVFMDKVALPRLIEDPKDVYARRMLKEKMLLDDSQIDAAIERGRWNDEDHHWGAKAFSDKVMFTFDPTELPPAWRAHGEGPVNNAILAATRLATLLRGYQFKTHALLKDDIYDEIKNHGNFRPLLPFVTLYPLMGGLISTLTALATANRKKFKEMLDDKNWAPGKMLDGFVDDIAHQIGDAQLMAAIAQFRKGRAELGAKIVDEWALGAIPSDALRTIHTAGNVAFAKNNRQRGKAIKSYAKETFPLAQTIGNLTPPPSHNGLSPLPPPPAP